MYFCFFKFGDMNKKRVKELQNYTQEDKVKLRIRFPRQYVKVNKDG